MNTHELGKLYQNNKDILIQQLSAEVKSEWVIVVKCQLSNFSAISWWEQVNFQWNYDEVYIVLDQHA